MRTRSLLISLTVSLFVPLLGGCAGGWGRYRPRCGPSRCVAVVRSAPVAEPKPEPEPPPARSSALYAGADGRPVELGPVLETWRDVDLVVFGELHGHPIGAATELEVLQVMAGQGRPVALAMEFFERDTQEALDTYLAGDLAENEFCKRSRQGKAYPKTHRPLIEFCRTHGFPVIAANAPRRLVSAWRKSEDDYEDFLAALPEEDREFLPTETSVIEDAYRERFLKLMGGARGESFFRSQSLWDDAMAEAMADFKDANPNHRIFFVVGGFHVTRGEGTVTKYKRRRPEDKVRVILMAMDNERHLPFDEEEIGTGDLVLNVPAPVKKRPTGPNPHAAPKKMPKMPPTHPPVKPSEGGGE